MVPIAKTTIDGVEHFCVLGRKLKNFITGRIDDGDLSSVLACIVVFVFTSRRIPPTIVGYTCTADGACFITNADINASLLNVLVLRLVLKGSKGLGGRFNTHDLSCKGQGSKIYGKNGQR